jgi:hypothetical protein
MACAMSFVGIMVNISLSDLLEVDKIGSIYYMSIAIAINIFIAIDKKQKDTSTLSE